MKRVILIFGMTFSFLVSFTQEIGTFTDERDGKTYKTVKIGTQTWMAENLNASVYNNGDTIREALTVDLWRRAAQDDKPACYKSTTNYELLTIACGRLYNWHAACNPGGLAPKGWHIPSAYEWERLAGFLGAYDYMRQLKSNAGWGFRASGGGNNSTGFEALPGGCFTANGFFAGKDAYYWSSTEISQNSASYFRLYADYDGVRETGLIIATDGKGTGMSIRCIKNQ